VCLLLQSGRLLSMIVSPRTSPVVCGVYRHPGNLGGLMLVDAQDTHTTPASVCATWNAWETFTPTMKQNLMSFALANMDALQVILP
jgi:hypothetical protein